MERAEGSLSWYSVTDGIGGVNTSILCGAGAWLRDMKERMQGRPLIGLRPDVLCVAGADRAGIPYRVGELAEYLDIWLAIMCNSRLQILQVCWQGQQWNCWTPR